MIFQYPYTDLYNLNLDWIIKAIKEVQAVIGDLGTVVNSVNGMTGDVQLTSEIINSIIGGVVNSFNGRAGNVTLTPQDVNDTLIDITYTSDPGETISDYTQQDLDLFYSNGVRVMIMVNSQGQPDRLYFLTMVGDDATPQQYTPTGAIAGVSSFNGQTGDVTGVSSFNGQSGAVTGVASFNGQAGAVTGVNSVNGATGAVALNAQNLPIAEGQTATIAAALAGKQPVLTFDSSPTAGSSNPVTSAGIAAALEGKQALLTFDTTPTLNSNNPVTSGGVAFDLARKQNTLTFDSTPTANSVNPVTSGGVYTAVNQIGTHELIGSTNSNSFENLPFPTGKTVNDYKFFLFCSRNQNGAMFHPSLITASLITTLNTGNSPIIDYFTDGTNNIEILLGWNATNQQIAGCILKTDGTVISGQTLYVYGIK